MDAPVSTAPREIRTLDLGKGSWSTVMVQAGRLFTRTMIDEATSEGVLRTWPLPDGEAKVLGTFKVDGA